MLQYTLSDYRHTTLTYFAFAEGSSRPERCTNCRNTASKEVDGSS